MIPMRLYFILMLSLFVSCVSPVNDQSDSLSGNWKALPATAWTQTGDSYIVQGPFENFELEGEFFLQEGQENSIWIRAAKSPEGESGYRINLTHNPDQQNPMGTIVNVARAKVLTGLPTKAWNHIRIQAWGDFLEVSLNDEVVCTTYDSTFHKGDLAFQAQEDIVGLEGQFRNFRIRQIREEISGDFSRKLEKTRREARKRAVPVLEQDLEAWHISGSSEWTLEAGELLGRSGPEGGYLISDSLYKDLYLSLAFRIKKEDNSGIFIRQHPDSANVSVQSGIECNIYDHNGFSHVYSTGSLVTHARAFSQLIEYDAWNNFEILAVGEHVVLYVNGRKASEHSFGDTHANAGHICLQAGLRIFSDEGPSEIRFRNIRLLDLDKE